MRGEVDRMRRINKIGADFQVNVEKHNEDCVQALAALVCSPGGVT